MLNLTSLQNIENGREFQSNISTHYFYHIQQSVDSINYKDDGLSGAISIPP
jgi:hypothetical protein